MPQLSVESLDTFDDALINEIGIALAPGDPQLEMFAEQMSALNEITATPATFFLARHENSIVGYGRIRQRTPNGNDWMLDVIVVPAPDHDLDECAAAILMCARNTMDMPNLEWWTRGITVDVATRVAQRVGLHHDRSIIRMELDLERLGDLHPIPTRAFAIDDAAAVVRVNNEAFVGHPDRAHIDIARLLNDFETAGNHYSDMRVIEDVDGIAGFVWVREQFARYGEIFVLALDRAHQRKGLGRTLLDAGISHLKDTYAPRRVLLYVESTNEHAISLYKSYGFEDVDQPLVSFTN